MPTRKPATKKATKNNSAISRFYRNNRYARFWILLLIFVLIALIAAIGYTVGQKRDIKASGQKLEYVKGQIESANLADNLNVSYACSLEPTKEFDRGPTYCAAILTGTIQSPTEQESKDVYTKIKAILFERGAFTNVEFTQANDAFDTNKGVHCIVGSPIKVLDTPDSQKYSFEVRCQLHTPFSYFELKKD